MKGVVFTEFLDLVEERYGLATADQIIQDGNLPSGGAYTSVGTYDAAEMLQLITGLSAVTRLGVPELLRSFGEHLFTRLVTIYPQFLEGSTSALSFLEHVDDYIHVEVRKLYPEAELPSFTVDAAEPGHLRMTYRSSRPLAELAEGLLHGCVRYFHEAIDIHHEDLSGGRGTLACFTLTKREQDS